MEKTKLLNETLNSPLDEINQLYDVFLQQLEDLQQQNDKTESDLTDAKTQIENLQSKISSLENEKVKLTVRFENFILSKFCLLQEIFFCRKYFKETKSNLKTKCKN